MIYLVEDDDSIRELVIYTLANIGLPAQGFERPSLFWEAMAVQLPDLILLDIMLPEEDGLHILRKLRSDRATAGLLIMMLSARTSEYDKVIGLDSGADDYLPKPFGMMELLARVKALLRRSENRKVPVDYTLGCLYVCPDKHIVTVNGEPVTLTLKEFELLCMLLANRGFVLSRDQVLSKVWGYNFDGESRTVDVHVRTLRQKLGEAGQYVQTVRGLGYKISGDTP